MNDVYPAVRRSEIDSDGMPVKRQMVFPSERFANGFHGEENSRPGGYGLFVFGILPHDFQTAGINIFECEDLAVYDTLNAQAEVVLMPQPADFLRVPVQIAFSAP